MTIAHSNNVFETQNWDVNKHNMIRKIVVALLAIITIIVIIVFGNKLTTKTPVKENRISEIRIGWQTTWATQGQLTEILKNTNLLNENGLKGDFKGFSSGASLNEAALAKAVDVIFTADQPAATLLSKNGNWVIIGRLMYNRVSLYVPSKSPIKTIADLKGKTVGMPFGAAAQRMALQAEKDAGLDPRKDVNNVNLGILEQSDLVRDVNATKWGDMDALAGFDPTPAIFEEKGLIRNLKVGSVVSVIVMSKDYIKNNSNSPEEFLKAFYDAYDFYRMHITQANNWFITDSKLNVSQTALGIAASVEPNLNVKSKKDIRLGFNNNDYNVLQDAADFIYNQSLIKVKVNMKDYIDLSYLQKASLQ